MLPSTSNWAITTFFNPEQYKNKYENYRTFRKNLSRQGLRLVAVECSLNGLPYELSDDDADIVVRVKSNSVLWQKERLLNIGLTHVPESCENVFWIDADVYFLNENWVADTERLLRTFKIVQPFASAIRLDRRGRQNSPVNKILKLAEKGKIDMRPSFGYLFREDPEVLITGSGTLNEGLCWAGKKYIFQRYGFYDWEIVGGGDWLMNRAFSEKVRMIPEKPHADEWVKNMRREVAGSVSYTPGLLVHLYHGSVRKRKYDDRNQIFKRNTFDPRTDLRLNEYGCFEWNTDNAVLKKEVGDYFAERDEESGWLKNLFLEKYINLRKYLSGMRGRSKNYYHRTAGKIGASIRPRFPGLYRQLKKIF